MDIFRKSLELLTRRQTNILSAAVVIMATVIFSQLLGLVRTRLLLSIFGASNNLGIFQTATQIPDSLFQVVIAGALYSAFIPVFSDFLARGEEKEGHKFASDFLNISIIVFAVVSLILFIFSPMIVQIMNLGGKYSPGQMSLMANLLRIIVIGQLLFIVASVCSAILQSYNRFLIPGIAAALYNLGIILGILLFAKPFGIYAPAYGVIIGAAIFILFQLPAIQRIPFHFYLTFSFKTPGVARVFHLMWPRTITAAITQAGLLFIFILISYIHDPGRNRVIFDLAQTLAFAPVVLIGQSMAQAAFPILARERSNFVQFKSTFLQSFMQLLYLIVPIAVVLLVLRIPAVRLIYGAQKLDWEATVLAGKTLGFFSLSLFAQALFYLVSRAFYALHDTKTPLLVNFFSTVTMLLISSIFILYLHLGISSLAVSYTIAGILQILVMLFLLNKKLEGFVHGQFYLSVIKIFTAAFFTGIALYIPIKLLDQLVFDTTRTINLLLLTGISTVIGLALYVLLTWLLDVKEASTFLLVFKKAGNYKEILGTQDEGIETTRLS